MSKIDLSIQKDILAKNVEKARENNVIIPTVVAGGGPHGLVPGGVKLAGDQPGSQAAEACAHLVAAGGEPLAGHGDNAAGDAA